MSSSVSCGIVGLPNAGKSTLFNSLTNANALVANYPFATIEPNVGVAEVADERLVVLAKMFASDRIIPATINITDIAGLVSGASHGEGLGNQFLSHIRSCRAIIQAVRVFEDSSISQLKDKLDPKKDIDIINTELILADLETINRKLPKLEKEAQINTKLKAMVNQYTAARNLLDQGNPLWQVGEDFSLLADLQLLTMKPIIYLFNIDEKDLVNTELHNNLANLVAPNPSMIVCAKLESELSQLEDYDRQELLLSYGLKESALTRLTKELYGLLSLQSFLTAGKKEIRAWTIKKGSTAPQAAGVIHSDFQRGFIAAEVVSYSELIKVGSWAAAKTAGKVRTEGKNYIVQEDDIIDFKFNVSK